MLRKRLKLVPRRGLEPPRIAPLVPETSASTSSATWARGGRECEAQESTHPRNPCQFGGLEWSIAASHGKMVGSPLMKPHTDDPGERCADAPTDPVHIARALRDRALRLDAPKVTGRDGSTHNE